MWRFAPARSDTCQAPPKRAAQAVPDHARLSLSGFLGRIGPFLIFRTPNSLLRSFQVPPTRNSNSRKTDRARQITHKRIETHIAMSPSTR